MTFWNWIFVPAVLLLVILGVVSSVSDACRKWAVSRLRRAGKYSEAILLNKRHEVDAATWKYGRQHPLVALDIQDLATLHRERGLYPEAERLYKQALAVFEHLAQVDGKTALELWLAPVMIAEQLAGMYVAQGKCAEAEAFYRRALDGYEKALGPDLATSGNSEAVRRCLVTMNNLACIYRDEGKHAAAEPLYHRVIAIQGSTGSLYAREGAASMENLGQLYAAQGKIADGESLVKQAIAVFVDTGGPEDVYVARSLNVLAGMYTRQGKYADAELIGERALAVFETVLGTDHGDTIRLRDNLATLRNEMSAKPPANGPAMG